MSQKITKRDNKGRIEKGSGLAHGLSSAPVYDCWVAMKARCQKSHHPNYHQYGGRGIKVCDRWVQSFEAFYADMGEKPTPKHTLDRIDVNGDYEPSNCRWVTIQEQQKNKRNGNKVTGVRWEHEREKWFVTIKAFGVQHFLGRFKDFEDAKKARIDAELKFWPCL